MFLYMKMTSAKVQRNKENRRDLNVKNASFSSHYMVKNIENMLESLAKVEGHDLSLLCRVNKK